MPKFRVHGVLEVGVSTVVEADDADHALEIVYEEFDGISNFAGNGGCDKLVGVYGSDDNIDDGGGFVEWKDAEEII